MQVANEQIDWREADRACQSRRPSRSNSLEQDNVRRKRLLAVRLLEVETGKAWQIHTRMRRPSASIDGGRNVRSRRQKGAGAAATGVKIAPPDAATGLIS